MGKPFSHELETLYETYSWSLDIPIAALQGLVGKLRTAPLFAIGSGGSLSAANLAALLHQRAGKICRAVTPLEFAETGCRVRDAGVLILTAGGSNPDVLACFRTVCRNRTP